MYSVFWGKKVGGRKSVKAHRALLPLHITDTTVRIVKICYGQRVGWLATYHSLKVHPTLPTLLESQYDSLIV